LKGKNVTHHTLLFPTLNISKDNSKTTPKSSFIILFRVGANSTFYFNFKLSDMVEVNSSLATNGH
jgi:hypothetical protein